GSKVQLPLPRRMSLHADLTPLPVEDDQVVLKRPVVDDCGLALLHSARANHDAAVADRVPLKSTVTQPAHADMAATLKLYEALLQPDLDRSQGRSVKLGRENFRMLLREPVRLERPLPERQLPRVAPREPQ